MQNQKIVTVENGQITSIKDGHFDRGYGLSSQKEAIYDLLNGFGTDWAGHIERLEKVIIGLLKRHPNDREFIQEAFQPTNPKWLCDMEEYYQNTPIKRFTVKEKEELIQKIREDRY
jgi:hypothetical protein